MDFSKEVAKSQLRKIYDVTTPSQFVWMIISAVMLLYFPVILETSRTYTRYRRLERPDYDGESMNDFWMIIPWSIALRLLKMGIKYFTEDFFISKLNKKYTGGDLVQKVDKWLKGVFKVIYFSFVFYIGLFQVLNKTNFGPTITFGDGDHRLALGNYPYTAMPYLLKFYYMLSISYYVEDGVGHILNTPKFDFWEMVLHHMIAFMLLLDSYMNGFWIFSALILPQMDFEDIWIGLIRCIMDFAPDVIIVLVYAKIIVSWIFMRFIVFGYVIFYSFSFTWRVSLDNDTNLILFNNLLLTVLVGMNIYWFMLLVKMGLGFIKSNECVDMQAVLNLEKDKIEKMRGEKIKNLN